MCEDDRVSIDSPDELAALKAAGRVVAETLRELGSDMAWLVHGGDGTDELSIAEDSHVAALQDGEISAAGLDVFEREPRVPAALRELDNVVLLPHVGSGSVETRQQMADLVLDNLRAFIATGKLLTPL